MLIQFNSLTTIDWERNLEVFSKKKIFAIYLSLFIYLYYLSVFIYLGNGGQLAVVRFDRDEKIQTINLRAGWYIDQIEIITNKG